MIIEEVDDLKELKLAKDKLVSEELIAAIKLLEGQINLVLNRKGEILEVSQGKLKDDLLSNLRRRKSNKRLAGLRILSFNSYLPGIEKIDLLLEYRLDNLTYYDWRGDKAQVIFPAVEEGRIIGFNKEMMDLEMLLDYDYLKDINRLEKQLKEVETVVVNSEREEAILVAKNE
ncbi:MAG: hypothetical protein R6V17_01270, partial [Halanaerobacter sp.]